MRNVIQSYISYGYNIDPSQKDYIIATMIRYKKELCKIIVWINSR